MFPRARSLTATGSPSPSRDRPLRRSANSHIRTRAPGPKVSRISRKSLRTDSRHRLLAHVPQPVVPGGAAVERCGRRAASPRRRGSSAVGQARFTPTAICRGRRPQRWFRRASMPALRSASPDRMPGCGGRTRACTRGPKVTLQVAQLDGAGHLLALAVEGLDVHAQADDAGRVEAACRRAQGDGHVDAWAGRAGPASRRSRRGDRRWRHGAGRGGGRVGPRRTGGPGARAASCACPRPRTRARRAAGPARGCGCPRARARWACAAGRTAPRPTCPAGPDRPPRSRTFSVPRFGPVGMKRLTPPLTREGVRARLIGEGRPTSAVRLGAGPAGRASGRSAERRQSARDPRMSAGATSEPGPRQASPHSAIPISFVFVLSLVHVAIGRVRRSTLRGPL